MKRAYGIVMGSALAMTAIVWIIGLSGCSQQAPVAPANSAASATPTAGQPLRVKVVRPSREHLKRLSSPQPAHVEAYERTDLSAKVAGYLESFGQVKGPDGKLRSLDIGDRVVKDQVLAKLAVPEMEQERLQKAALVDQAQAEVGQAEASLVAAEALVSAAKAKLEETSSHVARYEADLAYRKGEYERYVGLVKVAAAVPELRDEKLNQYRASAAGLQAAKAALASEQANIQVEQARLIKARADVASAKARLRVTEANKEYAVIMLNYATIRAPYDGVITRRLVDTGSFVQSATSGKAEPLFTLVRVDKLRIVAAIPETEASQVKLGQTASFVCRGQSVTGKVVRYSDALDSGTRTMRTEVELDAPKNLRPGMFGSLSVVFTDVPDALLLPASAVVPGNKPCVFLVENGKVRRCEVELGLSEAGRVQVVGGLTGKESVIADGKIAVKNGQVVEVAP